MPVTVERPHETPKRRWWLLGAAPATLVLLGTVVLLLPVVHPIGAGKQDLSIGRLSIAGVWGGQGFLWARACSHCYTDAEAWAVQARPGLRQEIDVWGHPESVYTLRIGKLSWAVDVK